MANIGFYYEGEILVNVTDDLIAKEIVNDLVKSQIPNFAKNSIYIVEKNSYVTQTAYVDKLQQIAVTFDFDYLAKEEKTNIEDYFIL